MIIEDRKTYDSIVEGALKKCQRMYTDGVSAYCTPVEYIALCLHFEHPPETIKQYYINEMKKGESRPTWHYFLVKEGVEKFPTSQWVIWSRLGYWSS